jgi:DNA-binding NtrC family response regulator
MHARILIMEDEDIIREMMSEVLIDAGYDVVGAHNSNEALRQRDMDGFKMLVTDIYRPGKLDGIEIAERAQAHRPQLPVVFVNGRPDVFRQLHDTGIRCVALAKPFPMGRLVEEVGRLRGGSRLVALGAVQPSHVNPAGEPVHVCVGACLIWVSRWRFAGTRRLAPLHLTQEGRGSRA